MRKFRIMIFDLDNTIYDWYHAFIPSIYAMVGTAADILNCDVQVLLDQLRQVHIKHHDVEHPYSLLETQLVEEVIRERGVDYVWQLLDPAFHIFNRTRKANLKLFPGVIETLDVLAARGIRLFAYTDSTAIAAWGRISRLGIGERFENVYCREGGRRNSQLPAPRTEASFATDRVVELPAFDTKPNPRVLADIVAAQNERMRDVAYVGDSLTKDILMAKRAQCFAIWAKYGVYTDREMYNRLVRISHWTAEDIRLERDYAVQAKAIEPDLICERSITELIDKIEGPASP